MIVFSSGEVDPAIKISRPILAKATVEFRLLNEYRGEFGFDWLRIDDKVIDSFDGIYYPILEGGCKNQEANMTQDEAYKKMRNDYNPHIVSWKPDNGSDVQPSNEYYVPYLTLFPKPFCESLTDSYNNPQYQATLQVLVEIDEDIDRLEFSYTTKCIQIDKPVLLDNLKCEKCVSKSQTITITCIGDINSCLAGEILIHAYPKVGKCHLAGKLQVLPNSESYRKKQNIVLVKVETKLDETKEALEIRLNESKLIDENDRKNKEIGKYRRESIECLVHMLHQALVYVNIEDAKFNLKDDHHFKIKGKYVNYNIKDNKATINEDYSPFSQSVYANFTTYVRETFLDKDENKIVVDGYLPIFFYGFARGYAAGQVENQWHYDSEIGAWNYSVFVKSANMFQIADTDKETVAHEVLHAFQLKHTHRDTPSKNDLLKDPNIRYIFPNGQFKPANFCTYNVMAYVGPNRMLTWKWQWDIIRENV